MKRIQHRRLLSLLLCAALVFTLIPVLSKAGSLAEAKTTSLPGIEAMKANGTTLNILEIAPAANEGSIGYYIDGQEPCRDWVAEAEKVSTSKNLAARKTYVNSIFTGLQKAGLLTTSQNDPAAPLSATDYDSTKQTYYDEVYPWQTHDGYTEMRLLNADSVSVTGSYKDSAGKNGAYTLISGFTLNENGAGGYNQNIEYFTATAEKAAEQYYYDPTFAKIDDVDSLASGTQVYTNSVPGTAYDKYEYLGTAGKDGFYLHYDPNTTYYKVTDSGTPQESKDTALNTATGRMHCYLGVLDTQSAYISVSGTQKGYFDKSTNPVLKYVGSGGTVDLNQSGSGSTVTIQCSTVYYKGGFTNNDWFLRKVFDYDDTELDTPEELAAVRERVKFTVTTVTPDKVTAAQVDSAGLIVLSDGFVPGGTASAYTTAMDTTVAKYICNAVNKASAADTDYGKPVIVDYRLTSSASSSMKGLAATLTGTDYALSGKTFTTENYQSYVGGSVYVFNPDASRKALATAAFSAPFTETLYNSSTAPFGEVWDDIGYENFLRINKDAKTTNLLSTTVSMASCVRYILSYNSRSGGVKSALHVLDIEPGSGTNSIDSTGVLKWLGYTDKQINDTNYAKPTVTITTMSTAEFNSKIDNLTETYDLIYVGSNNAYASAYSGDTYKNSKTNEEKNSYKISDISSILGNKYLYANIGVQIADGNSNCRTSMLGLLDSDYESAAKMKGINKAGQFRYPGNDLTAAKLSALTDYASAGYPVVVSDGLVSGGSEGTSAFSFKVKVTAETAESNYVPLTAKAVATSGSLPAGLTPSYQWYRYNGQPNNTTEVSSSASYNAKSSTYFCEIIYTVGGNKYTARSADVTVKNGTVYTPHSSGSPSAGRVNYADNHYSFFSANATASGTTLSVSPSIDEFYPNTEDRDPDYDSIKNVTYSYQWYCHYWNWLNEYSIPDATGSSLSLDPPVTSNWPFYNYYYCVVSVSSLTYKNVNYSVSSGTLSNTTYADSTYYYFTSESGLTATVGTGATTTQVPAQAGIAYTLNTNTVDCNSRVYSLLDTIKRKPNVTKVSAVSGTAATLSAQTALRRYANLSKPAIAMLAQPVSYYSTSTADSLAVDCGGALSYTFTIANDTDPYRGKTNYRCNLYIDANGDGLYKSDELFSDLVVTQEGAAVANGKLRAGKRYTVTRQLLDDQLGILPWKLEVVALDSDGKATPVTASVIGYTHRKPAAAQIKTIQILQINMSDGLNLQAQTSTNKNGAYTAASGTKYTGIYGKLFDDVSSDFKVSITTITIDDINDIAKKPLSHRDEDKDYVKDTDGTTKRDSNRKPIIKTYSTPSDYFNSFDMLVLGFKDFYGSLTAASAEAVGAYIATGKATLFTHDCTSYYNSQTTATTTMPTGYFFNNMLRDAVGLDVYGVTSPKYGITRYANGAVTKLRTAVSGTDYVANAYKDAKGAQADTTVLQGIKDAGYSVAYVPGSEGVTTEKTQGYTQGQIDRTRYESDENVFTKKVSQVNKGQITTYPYDINTTSFTDSSASETGLSDDRLTVAATHFQYYQLNMNEPDTVVWYCLAFDDTNTDYLYNKNKALKNDGSNTYYIYSKGNVTYSGAGHYGASPNNNADTAANSNENEAKLFVNTMFAAYRVVKVPPKTGFTVDDGTTVTTDYMIPAEPDSDGKLVMLSPDTADNATQKVWFKITDNNIGAGKTIKITFTAADSTETRVYPAGDGETAIPVYDASGTSLLTYAKNEKGQDVPVYAPLVSGSYYVKLYDLRAAFGQSVSAVKLHVDTSFNGKDTVSADADLKIKPFDLFDLN